MFAEIPHTTYIAIILLAFLSVFTTLLGVTLAIYIGKNERAIAAGIGFSAGIMLLISFFELVPEAVNEIGMGTAFVTVTLGMLIIASLHWIIPHTHLVEEKGAFSQTLLKSAYLVVFGLILHDVPEGFAMANSYIASPSQGVFNQTLLKSAYLVVFGLILHDVPEGFAMANSYIASPSQGVLVALAIAIHNIPEEFAMAVPIIMVKKRRFLFIAAFLSGLAEPLGAIVGLMAVHFHPTLNPLFMAFAAGAMIFISVHELLPMARKYHNTKLFILGAVVSVFVYALLVAAIPE